jgi:signal transduction histidine kinase
MIRQGGPPAISRDRERAQPPAGHSDIAEDGAASRLSQLAAELSHDLRVPLSTIVASVEMLEDRLRECPDPAVGTLLDHAAKAADRMLRMLDHYMTVSPVVEGPMRVDVDLDKVANQLVRDSGLLLELAGATLKVGRLPVVRAKPEEMYSVLQNLITNAVKFTRSGVRPWVTISARQIPYGWRVSVSDNGIGIPAPRRMDVFTLFSRVDPELDGHGIGLGTVARTVHSLGGRVGAEEAPGGGAEVWFELPASADA